MLFKEPEESALRKGGTVWADLAKFASLWSFLRPKSSLRCLPRLRPFGSFHVSELAVAKQKAH